MDSTPYNLTTGLIVLVVPSFIISAVAYYILYFKP